MDEERDVALSSDDTLRMVLELAEKCKTLDEFKEAIKAIIHKSK